MKTIAPPPADYAGKTDTNEHVGKQYECPECGATNEVEKGDRIHPVTRGNGGVNKPVLMHYDMPPCPSCKRVSSVSPWELRRPLPPAFGDVVGRAAVR